MVIKTERLSICIATHRNLKFLLRLWNDPEIMRYAGFAKNWRYTQIKKWYDQYQKKRVKYGNTEAQFIVKLKNGILIGESGVGRLRPGWSCPNYKAPRSKLVLMADVKLAKSFWNRGYGTEAMRAIVRYVFTKTKADIFIVPPHRDNLPAVMVYEKAGFKKTNGLWFRYHMIYEMTRKNFIRVYQN